MPNKKNKSLLLGTAQWGWTVSKKEAFALLDAWMAAGLRKVDAATNYPINKNPEQFRASEKIIQEYTQAHGIQDLQITMKIGSLDNMRSPDVNLAPSFILMMGEEYQRIFGKNLHTVMAHWDNRSEQPEIMKTLEAFLQLKENLGLQPGLSGIKFPDVYAKSLQEMDLLADIQLKHNVLYSDFKRYAPFFTGRQKSGHRFFAYGINAGGIKLQHPYPSDSTFLVRGGDPAQLAEKIEILSQSISKWNVAFVRPPIRTMNHLGLIYAGLHPRLAGLVLGFSKLSQLEETLDFWRNLDTFDYSDVFKSLDKAGNPS